METLRLLCVRKERLGVDESDDVQVQLQTVGCSKSTFMCSFQTVHTHDYKVETVTEAGNREVGWIGEETLSQSNATSGFTAQMNGISTSRKAAVEACG